MYFKIEICPLYNIKILKLINLVNENIDEKFVYLISVFLGKFDNAIDNEFSFMEHFSENLNLKQAFYFLFEKYEGKINALKKMKLKCVAM